MNQAEVIQPGAPQKRHRWPLGTDSDRGRQPGHGRDDWAAHVVERYTAAVGDMTGLLAKLEPGKVADSRTVILDASGQATVQTRLPFQALHVTSHSENLLTITSSTPQANAPTNGPGVGIVGIRGQQTFNMAGYCWSLYGGNPGDQVTVQAFTRPMPPVGGPGTPGQNGNPVSTQITGLAPGVSAFWTVPGLAGGPPVTVLSLTAFLTTDAVVANRFVQVSVFDGPNGTGNFLSSVGDTSAVVASTTIRVTAAPGAAQLNASVGLTSLPLNPSVLLPTWSIQIKASGGDAGDQWSAFSVVTRT